MEAIMGWLIFLLAAGEVGLLILAFVQAYNADQRHQQTLQVLDELADRAVFRH